ncbi:hypothetical protein A6769_35505 [Nostoc punctiforme NIES-2108]|uniref:DUF4276 family protein n=1 Tax=Nostoc punctiforme NIES-2108 TaxID=1356359 RepID=A0A367R0V6_NOSPU|nr:hypothetical protein A6769_35505 [Nostoc punctiforme NIES-2108]
MKIGILCEGEKTDAPVINTLLKHLFPSVEFFIRGKTKEAIFKAGDIELEKIFSEESVERALIVWDLLPLGHQMGVSCQWSEKPSRSEQRQMLLNLLCNSEHLSNSLKQQALHLANRYKFVNCDVEHPNGKEDLFKLISVCYTCDGWLLSDGSVLKDLASSNSRQAERWNPPDPDRCQNPAGELKRYFGQGYNKRLKYFNKSDHNIVITEEYIKQGKVESMLNSSSFSRMIYAIKQWVQL